MPERPCQRAISRFLDGRGRRGGQDGVVRPGHDRAAVGFDLSGVPFHRGVSQSRAASSAGSRPGDGTVVAQWISAAIPTAMNARNCGNGNAPWIAAYWLSNSTAVIRKV